MQSEIGPLDTAIGEIDQLIKLVSKLRHKQVRGVGDRQVIRAYALRWSTVHKAALAGAPPDKVALIESLYDKLLKGSYVATSRSSYLSNLKALKASLVDLQSAVLSIPRAQQAIPDFAPLITNREMATLLGRRAKEIVDSLSTAPFSASVMMGALLEALFLARINAMGDKRPIFNLKATPKDKTGKARELKEWGLNDYIEVSHELGWIRKAAKDISSILRDYRNVIHPVKELSLMIELKTETLVNAADAKLLWRVFCEISEQIVRSVKKP